MASCSDGRKEVDLSLLRKSWVFEDVSKDISIVSGEEQIVLVPLSGNKKDNLQGMQFMDTGKLVMFKIVKGKKQDLDFIHGLWALDKSGRLVLNLDGTKPVFTILELNDQKLRIKRDELLVD